MAGHSVSSLLAWMKDTSRLSGWDAVIALDVDKANGLFQNTYVINLSQGIQKVPPCDITLPDTNVAHYFTDVILGSPSLSCARTSFDSAAVTVQLPLLSGVHTLVQTRLDERQILRLADYTPLNGPQLQVELQLASAPPDMALDLALSENVVLLFPGTPVEQRETGKLFQAWLGHPDNRERVYPLGSFTAQANPLLRVRRVDIRSQLEDAADGATRQADKAALLFFLTMEHGITGAFPGSEADFHYLIANDADQAYAATALFSLPVLYRAAFGYAVLQLLQAGEFDFISEPGEPMRTMIARAGSLAVPAIDYRNEQYIFESEAFDIPASGGPLPLTVEFAADQATQTWQFPCPVRFRYRPLDGTAWQSHDAIFNVSLKHEFHLTPDESGAGAMEGHLFIPYAFNHEVQAFSGLPTNLEPAELEQINGFIARVIKRRLLEGFSQTLNTTETDTFLQQWSLAGGDALQPVVSALPYDLAVFGRVNPGPTALRISPQQALLAPGAQLQLNTEAAGDVRWAVHNPPGSSGNAGTITPEGLYRAPPASTLTEAFHRVLVVATDSQTSNQAAALIAIQVSAISISPLIQVINYGEQVEFSAASLDGSDPAWEIKHPVPGASGTLVRDIEGNRLYAAGPKVADKTYVLDEIEFTASEGAHARSAWVLVRQRTSLLVVRPVEDNTLPEGQVRLEVLFDDEVVTDVRWSLPCGGPGAIDDGIYSSPTTAERFVLVFAEADVDGLGTFEGHVILPLPLDHFPTVLQALAGH